MQKSNRSLKTTISAVCFLWEIPDPYGGPAIFQILGSGHQLSRVFIKLSRQGTLSGNKIWANLVIERCNRYHSVGTNHELGSVSTICYALRSGSLIGYLFLARGNNLASGGNCFNQFAGSRIINTHKQRATNC